MYIAVRKSLLKYCTNNYGCFPLVRKYILSLKNNLSRNGVLDLYLYMYSRVHNNSHYFYIKYSPP